MSPPAATGQRVEEAGLAGSSGPRSGQGVIGEPTHESPIPQDGLAMLGGLLPEDGSWTTGHKAGQAAPSRA